MLISGIQQNASYIYIFGLFSLIGYYKIWKRVPCAIRQVLAGYLFCTQKYVYFNPTFLIYPSPPLSPLVTIN